MDLAVLGVWLLRLLFLALLYLFLGGVVRGLLRDLRAAVREPERSAGRLRVLASPGGEPPEGATIALEPVTTLGRDVNNRIVLDDEFVSGAHAVLTFRGRAWYLEDLASTNGSFVNGDRVEGTSPVAPGDDVQLGRVHLRLERPEG
jgi:hypothetical protein